MQEITLERIIEELEQTRTDIEGVDAPSSPGVYAIYVNDPSTLPITGTPKTGLLYIGMSSDLAYRDFDTHFSSSGTGYSTLRRTLGALLKQHLQLCAVPRGKSESPSNFTCYRFLSEGEDRLTRWMEHNLEIG